VEADMECDICDSESQDLVNVEVPRFASMPAARTRVCPRCLTYDMLRALVRVTSHSAASDLKPVA
jgi:hypothetical protein